MSRHRKRPGDFEPFFDWGESEDGPTVGAVPPEGVTARIVAACEDWQRRGGVLVRCHFGVKTVRVTREKVGKRRDEKTGRTEIIWGGLSGFYETQKYCCPLAPLVDGLPSRFNPLADFASALGVDHLWILGFIHGFDKTELYTGRRAEQLGESLSYVDGHAAGVKVASQFYVVDLGWEL